MSDTIKALSIRQPWAWLILNAGKDIENRNWPTRVRGRILIHAAKSMTRYEWDDALEFVYHMSPARPFRDGLIPPAFGELDRGGIVGSVEIFDCVEGSRSPWFFGPHGFILRDPRPLPFLPWKGQLGFFDVPLSAIGGAP